MPSDSWRRGLESFWGSLSSFLWCRAVAVSVALAALLARAYGARILRSESVAAVRADAMTAMEDPAFEAAARQKLIGLTDLEEHVERIGGAGTLQQRDFVAAVNIETLREWLGE